MTTAFTIGLTYSEFLDIDIRTLNNLVDGFNRRREINMNDDLLVQHIAAGKIAAAVWGDRSFSRPIKPIKISGSSTESRNERVIKTLKAKGVI